MTVLFEPHEPAAEPIDTPLRLVASTGRGGHRTRIGLLDRPWAGHWSALLVTPIAVPSISSLRASWKDLMDAHPDALLTSRISDRHWVGVPAEERDAFVRSTVVRIEDPVGRADDVVARSLDLIGPDRPILIGVGERSLLVLLSHLVGDGATVTRLVQVLLSDGAAELGSMTRHGDIGDILAATRVQARAHGRQWWAAARERVGRSSGSSEATAAPVSSGPAQSTEGRTPTSGVTPFGGTAVVSVRWTLEDLSHISAWRKQHASDTSLTPILTAATQRALIEAGLPMATDGFHTLVDLRRYLPESGQGFLPGNLAKSVRIDADPADLTAVAAASGTMLTTARPVLSTLLGALAGGVPRTRTESQEPASESGPVAMTFNSMPSLPGVAELPWLPGGTRQFIGLGYPARSRSITVFAVRLPEHVQVTAVFPASMADPEAVRTALADLPLRIGELLETSPKH